MDEDRFYVVDLFAVNGGEQHDQSWHAMLTAPELPDLDWQAQGKGTLAGPDVAPTTPWTDRWGRKRNDFPMFLRDIRRATLEKPSVWIWNSGLPEGDALRLHVIPLGGPAEVIMGRTRTPAWPKNQLLDYLLVRRQVRKGAASHFLTVLDAFQNAPVVENARVLSEKPVVLEVTRVDGVDEITVHLPDGPSLKRSRRPVGVRVRSRRGDQWVRDVRIGKWAPGAEPGYVTTRIAALDYASRQIAVPARPDYAEVFAVGRTVRIFNGSRSGLFRVEGVRREGARLWLTLDHTALLARGPVKEVNDGQVLLDTHLTFAARTDIPGPKRRIDPFAGAWLGEGRFAQPIRTATGEGEITLKKKTPASRLRRRFSGKVVSIWQYGVGDRVEAARIRAIQPFRHVR